MGVRRISISRPLFEPLPLTLLLGELRSNIFIVDYLRVATCSSRGCCATTQNALTAKVEEMTAQMAALQEEVRAALPDPISLQEFTVPYPCKSLHFTGSSIADGINRSNSTLVIVSTSDTRLISRVRKDVEW